MPFWTNKIYLVSAVILFVTNSLFIVMPASFWLNEFFEVEAYTDEPRYRYRVVAGVAACCLVTYIAEMLIAGNLTHWYDKRTAKKQRQAFD